MRSLLQRWVVVVLVVLCLGTSWALLQSAAWFSMLVNYSRQTSLGQAIEMTFDGKHPCRLCHVVNAGQAQERQEGKKRVAPDERLQLGLPPERFVLIPPPRPENACVFESPASAPGWPPPTPPPRA